MKETPSFATRANAFSCRRKPLFGRTHCLALVTHCARHVRAPIATTMVTKGEGNECRTSAADGMYLVCLIVGSPTLLDEVCHHACRRPTYTLHTDIHQRGKTDRERETEREYQWTRTAPLFRELSMNSTISSKNGVMSEWH